MGEYLAIKNWVKFQSLRGKGRYIFDYTQQDDEPVLAKLSFFQRGVYQEIRRYRGRSGKNMLYDHEFIACSTSARLKDRPRLPQAVRELIACGLLVITNQEVDSVKVVEKEIEKEKESEKKKEPKPSARKARGERPAPDKVSKGLGESKHTRIHGMISSAYREANGVDPPWDESEGAQLKRLLDATPRWEDQLYAQCLGNMYRSEGFPPGTRPREFLPWLPKCLKGPLDRFKNDQGATNGRGTSKAEQRNADISETTRAIFSPSRHLPGDAPKSLPDKTPT